MRAKLKTFYLSIFVVAVLATGVSLGKNEVSALSGSSFEPGRIIDDSLFYSRSTMTAGQIQEFLNSKLPVCDTNGTQSYSYYFNPSTGEVNNRNEVWDGDQWVTTSRATYGQRVYAYTGIDGRAPYTCLKSYTQNIQYKAGESGLCSAINAASNQSAAQIIDTVSRACNISQKALIVLLQKEQGLVTDDWPWPINYRSATGYGCPDTAPCDAEYYGFFNQVYNAARQFQRYKADPSNWNHIPFMTNNVRYSPVASCGTKSVYIQNYSTAGLYNYTPYTPNTAALNNLYGTGDGCSAYGNRNFWRYYNDWFGTTHGYIYNGTDYSNVFDSTYYENNNADVKAVYGGDQYALFLHYMRNGLYEGRQAIATFNVNSYRARYTDLRAAYGSDLQKYLWHYSTTGINEGRVGTGDFRGGTTVYRGVDYKNVYSFDYYTRTYPDIWNAYGLNDEKALWHFINVGVNENRQGIATFSTNSYRTRYPDLRTAYGNELQKYLWHYTTTGVREQRLGTGDYRGGTTIYNGVNYSNVYNFDYYTRTYPDIWAAYGLSDSRALWHFINVGAYEGRQAIASFNVNIYKNRYPDLQTAYGNDMKRYLWHYTTTGVKEGRSGI